MAETTKHKHIKETDIIIRAHIIVVSDSLTAAEPNIRKNKDKSSIIVSNLLSNKGFTVADVSYVADEIDDIQNLVKHCIEEEIELILTIGGTGIAKRDVTIEALTPLIEKTLSGYGELFRYLTYKTVGTVSIMTRALAGIAKKSVIVALPGSPNAVELGTKIIAEEIVHIQNLLRK
ncbi:MAG: MogA/MoaB family molybdenum cofactor biosynthesis protein [Candidatus Heimdallarchaeaceae archaeon]